MKKISYILFAILSIPLNNYAQKETSWWYFGQNAGLNFNVVNSEIADDGTTVDNMPKPVVGPLNTFEGCFTVSTYDGKLLFSSDGIRVYDKVGNLMPNGAGLLGDPSATQSGIVIPRPGSLTEYYVVTVPSVDVTPTNGLRYSIVDMSLNNGLGDVIVASKNTLIRSGYTFENIAAVPNANGRDYWLIHRTYDTFYVFPVTDEGISSTPSQTIAEASITTAKGLGELVVSSDYTKLIACNWVGGSGNQIISAEFNPATGKIINIKTEIVPNIVYGAAFSPDNSYVYVTAGYYNNSLLCNTWSGLRSGIPSYSMNYGLSNLKPGMDGRLYGIKVYRTDNPIQNIPTKDLYVIMNPNDGGTIVKYFPQYLLNTAYLGLPSFPAGFVRLIPDSKPFACATHDRSYSVEVDLSGGNAPVRLEWDFGDGTPVVSQVVSLTQLKYTQKHSYLNAGLYTISVIPYKADGTKAKIINMDANIVNCTLRTNLMNRSNLLNSKQQE
uniref:hypothetical protein n=1 Tax=uncultured Dysgonomonas sp. TaxID=206096 RepID=UPI002616573A|nr:hypothetical protein [uncultured Dysgonomonas sp.]